MTYLQYREPIHKTPAITRAAECIDPFFKDCPSEITSGWRYPIEQLQIIMQKAARHEIIELFPEYKLAIGAGVEHMVFVPELNEKCYWWQRVWSKLLNIGDIVNPPVTAEAIFDYYRPGSLENKRGKMIPISRHQRGLALDIGGGKDLLARAQRVMEAKQSGNCFIHDFLIERINNAIHIDVLQIG